MTIGVFENQFEFNLLCDNITNIDKNIELVAVLNNKGRVIEMKASDDVITKEFNAQKREMFFMECVLQATMNKDHDYEFGRVKCSILERERCTMYSFSLFNHIILVISIPVLDTFDLKSKIASIIEGNK